MIKFESRTMVLSNVMACGVAVGANVMAVAFEVEDRYELHRYVHGVVEHVHGFQTYIQ
jgi:hypothetical protein